jgi:hypothetical protein
MKIETKNGRLFILEKNQENLLRTLKLLLIKKKKIESSGLR